MNRGEIERLKRLFLHKSGYLKKGSSFLSAHFNCTVENIKVAKEEYRKDIGLGENVPGMYFKEPESTFIPRTAPEGMQVSKMWDKADGSVGYSYKAIDKVKAIESDDISPEDLKTIFSDVMKGETIIPIVDTKTGKAILNIYISDEHLGCDPSDGMYQNSFGIKVLASRHEDVITEIAKLASFYGRFHQINLINLGDAIDGQDGKTTRGGHSLQQNLTNREVFEAFLVIHKSTIDTLFAMDVSDGLNYFAIANSNHGGDMEYMVFSALKQYVEGKYEGFNFIIMEDFFNTSIIGNHIFIFTHGKDDTHRTRGLPLHVDKNADVFIRDYISEKLSTDSRQIHVIKGDLHQSASEYTKQFRYRNCGSMMGSSAWIMTNFGNTKPATDYDVIIGDTILEGHIRHK